MNDDQKALLWIGAFRYYCGRMTYAVSEFCDALRLNWEEVPEHARQIIARDLEEEFERDDRARRPNSNAIMYPLGNDCDRQEWVTIRAHIHKNMEQISGTWRSKHFRQITVGSILINNDPRSKTKSWTVHSISPDSVWVRSDKGRFFRIPRHRVHTFPARTGYSLVGEPA